MPLLEELNPNLKKDFVKCKLMFMHPQFNTTPNCNTNKKMEIQQDINTNLIPTHCSMPHVAIFNLY
jgi:hypothetical protein